MYFLIDKAIKILITRVLGRLELLIPFNFLSIIPAIFVWKDDNIYQKVLLQKILCDYNVL